MMTELANKIRRIPPKNTDCMLIRVRNIRYQGRSILGARTGGTPPAKPGSPRVNFPTVMGSIVSVVWARHLGGTRHPRVLLASRSHFSALGVSNVKLRTMAAVINFLSVRYRPLARLSRTSPPSRPRRRLLVASWMRSRSARVRPTRRRRDDKRRVPRTHAQRATRPRLTFRPTPPPLLPLRAPQVDAQLPLTEGGSVDFKSSDGFKKAKATLSQPSTPPSRRTTSRSPPAPPTSSSPPPPSPPP